MKPSVPATILGLLLQFGGCSRWSCYELRFAVSSSFTTEFVRVEVTAEDEMRHPAFAWIAGEVVKGQTGGSRRGRWLVDDLWALARERGVDPSAVMRPLFIVRGTPVLATPINHCL